MLTNKQICLVCSVRETVIAFDSASRPFPFTSLFSTYSDLSLSKWRLFLVSWWILCDSLDLPRLLKRAVTMANQEVNFPSYKISKNAASIKLERFMLSWKYNDIYELQYVWYVRLPSTENGQ